MKIVPDSVFKKMSNKQKMNIEYTFWKIDNPESIVMIRTNRKSDWYTLSAFFIETKEWWIRHSNYDVLFAMWNWTHIDFEYGWVRLFTPNAKSYMTWSVYY